MFVVHEGTCLKSNILDVIISKLQEIYGNLSNNPTQDNTQTTSDGLVFKMTRKDGLKEAYVRVKSYISGANYRLWVTPYEGYTPGVTPGTNGVFTGVGNSISTNQALDVGCGGGTLTTINVEWKIIIHDDCFIIYTRPTSILSTNSLCYFGWMDDESNRWENSMSNPFFMIGISASGGTYGKTIMKKYDGTMGAYTDITLISNLPTINPQIDGRYLMAPIISRDASPNLYWYGLLKGMYTLPATNIADRDILTVGSETYLVIHTFAINSYNPLPSSVIALRIA